MTMSNRKKMGDKKIAIYSLLTLVSLPIYYLITMPFIDPIYHDVILFGYAINTTTPLWVFLIWRKLDE